MGLVMGALAMTTHSSDTHGDLPSRTAQAREDARLVEETLAGNQLSFQLLVERYSDRLFALARHYTKNPVEIEDVVPVNAPAAEFGHRWLLAPSADTALPAGLP